MLSIIPKTNFGTNLFDDLSDWFSDPFFRKSAQNAVMKTDIQEKDGLYLMTVDMPGYEKENIKAELKGGYLTISAETTSENEHTDEQNYIHKERYKGSCSRSYFVGEDLKQEDIKAAYKDGILHLSFPKETPKQLEKGNLIAIE